MSRQHTCTRRTALRALGVGAGLAATGATATAQEAPTFDGWLDNVGNYDGVVDETGSDSVTVQVGSQANGGAFGFSPPAVRVDPGTEVVWEWTGSGGVHNVLPQSGDWGSELVGDSGHTYTRTFEEEGVVKYSCEPHAGMGMKGVVVVGDAGPSGGGGGGGGQESFEEPDYGGWFDDVGNYESTADETGTDSVTVQVGSQANGGAYGFSPPAVRVDPGTEVVWEWTGDGGVHNVLPDEGSWGSELVDESGHTYTRTFEEPGIHRYVCEPHAGMGMKGAVVVTGAADGGDGESAEAGWSEPTAQPRPVGESSIEPLELAFVGGFGALLLFPALVGIAMGLGSDGRPDDEPGEQN